MTNDTNHNNIRKNSKQGENTGQPEPLSGSKKVKNHNHTRQKKNQGHDF